MILTKLFNKYFGDEEDFANTLYFSWEQAQEMQSAGMVIGGHSNNHVSMASLDIKEQEEDISLCKNAISENINSQNLLPFSFPYGKTDSFNSHTIRVLKSCGFDCSFSTNPGYTKSGDDIYSLTRQDVRSPTL